MGLLQLLTDLFPLYVQCPCYLNSTPVMGGESTPGEHQPFPDTMQRSTEGSWEEYLITNILIYTSNHKQGSKNDES